MRIATSTLKLAALATLILGALGYAIDSWIVAPVPSAWRGIRRGMTPNEVRTYDPGNVYTLQDEGVLPNFLHARNGKWSLSLFIGHSGTVEWAQAHYSGATLLHHHLVLLKKREFIWD